MHEIAGFGINQNPVITLKNLYDQSFEYIFNFPDFPGCMLSPVVPEEVYKTGKNGQIAKLGKNGQKRPFWKTHQSSNYKIFVTSRLNIYYNFKTFLAVCYLMWCQRKFFKTSKKIQFSQIGKKYHIGKPRSWGENLQI